MIYSGNKPFIYASFANGDRPRVLPIIEAMQRLGFRIWFEFGAIDKFDFSTFDFSGKDWYAHGGHLIDDCGYDYDPTVQCLYQSDCLIVFITKNAAKAPNVRRDVFRAINANKKVLAVYVEPCDLDHGLLLQLGIVQSLFLERFDNRSDFYDELKRSEVLKACLGKEIGYFPSLLSPRKTVAADCYQGEEVVFGEYPQDGKKPLPLEWMVIFKGGELITLLSKYIVAFEPFHKHDKPISYKDCSLRKWLNKDFFNDAFSKSERQLVSSEGVWLSGNAQFDLYAEDVLLVGERVFLVSDTLEIADKHLLCDETRKCVATPNAIRSMKPPLLLESYDWWTRTSGIDSRHAAAVYKDGVVDESGWPVNWKDVGVRPCIQLRLSNDEDF